uniref:C3H1-type domain-containing protein n=1 Tax=Oryza brachyantha TaxID=4533 RepID=J3LNE9_ORYBR
MDAYEATKVVFSRIQALDPDHAAKIMGFLLIQDHGDKEMIRLAFGPEALLQSVIAQARKDLALLPASSPTVSAAGHAPFLLSRQSSGRGAAPALPATSPSSWAQAQPFSRSNSMSNGAADELLCAGEELSPVNSAGVAAAAPPFFPRGGDSLLDDFQLQEQLAFLHEGAGGVNPGHALPVFDGAECWPSGGPGHRRSASVNELFLGGGGGDAFGWKPCLYYARGFCKNGSSCRFVHGGLSDDFAVAGMDAAAAEQQQCQDFLPRSKSQHLGPAAFPFSPTGPLPGSPSATSKCLSLLLQQQHNDNQRAAAAAMMLGGGGGGHGGAQVHGSAASGPRRLRQHDEPRIAPDLPHLPGRQHVPRGGRLQLLQHLRAGARRAHSVPAEAHVRVRHLRVPRDGEADLGQGQPAFHLRRPRARQALQGEGQGPGQVQEAAAR